MPETIVKHFFGFSNLLFVIKPLGTYLYTARELIAALAIFSLGFAALILIAATFLLYFHVSGRGLDWFHEQAPQWNRASRDWMVALFRNEQMPVLVAVSVQSPALKELSRRVASARIPE